jgi:hypothetical protein
LSVGKRPKRDEIGTGIFTVAGDMAPTACRWEVMFLSAALMFARATE